MRDFQRERLKHLVANAIIELWKKETGSLSSVVIEGTICITSGSGKTTVVQVADKFNGSIPEASEGRLDPSLTPDLSPGYGRIYGGGIPRLHLGHGGSPTGYGMAPRVECNNPAAMQAFLDNLSPASLVSPNTDYSRSSRESRSPSMAPNHQETSMEQAMDTSDIKDELDSESESDLEESRERKSPEIGTGGICPGTGYYTCATSSPNSANSSAQERPSSLPPTPNGDVSDQRPLSTQSSPAECLLSETKKEDGENSQPFDLTRKDPELALSPPQSYTAQVRDVIRQRLLAARASGGQPADGGRNTTPQMLSSLGLQRTPTEEEVNGNIKSSPRTSPQEGQGLLSKLPPNNGARVNGSVSNGPLAGDIASQYPTLASRAGLMSPGGPLHAMLRKKSQIPPLIRVPYPGDGNSSTPVSMVSRDSDRSLDMTSPEEKEGEMNGEQRIYRCDYCQKTFLFKSKYHEHLPVHTNARPFQCHLCSRTYKYKYDLRVHLRTHMGIPTKSTICPFCSTKFDTNKMLRMHIKEDHRDKQKVSEEECTQPLDNLPPAL